MKPYSDIPGVQYPDPATPEATPAYREPPKPKKLHGNAGPSYIYVNGRNYSKRWLRWKGAL